jgi:hypothetical protein
MREKPVAMEKIAVLRATARPLEAGLGVAVRPRSRVSDTVRERTVSGAWFRHRRSRLRCAHGARSTKESCPVAAGDQWVLGPAPAPRLFNHARIHLPAAVIAPPSAPVVARARVTPFAVDQPYSMPVPEEAKRATGCPC